MRLVAPGGARLHVFREHVLDEPGSQPLPRPADPDPVWGSRSVPLISCSAPCSNAILDRQPIAFSILDVLYRTRFCDDISL
jgi:hypothetical protein